MALRPRKIQKVSKHTARSSETKGLDCKECGRFVDELSMDIKAVTCDRCVAKVVAPPEFKPKATTTGFDRGWHLKKEFIAPDGTKYSFGRVVDANATNDLGKPSGTDKQSKKSAAKPKARAATKQSKPGKRGRTKAK